MIDPILVHNFFVLFLVFYFGCIIGSFLNVVILRLPEGKTLGGRSRCPHCGHELGAFELVPLLSYVWLGGKCRGCRGRISLRYLVIEAAAGCLFLLGWLHFLPAGDYIGLVKFWYLAAICVAVFAIDFEHYLILDSIVLPGIGIFALLNIIQDAAARVPFWHVHSHFILGIFGALLGALPFFAIWLFSKGKWMGFGDIKFIALLGMALGPANAIVALFLAIFSGTLVSLPLLAFGKKTLASRLPFGTFLAAGALAAVWFGQPLAHWYLGLLGVL